MIVLRLSVNSASGLTDQKGRGCILTSPTTQWQCDAGASPMGGFAVGCDGTLTYKGNSKFVACPTGDHGGYNIYGTAPQGQGGCVDITLNGDSCHAGCPPPPPPPPPKTCPADLSGHYEVRPCSRSASFFLDGLLTTLQFPHLIIPVDKSKPDTAQPTSYFGEVSATVSSIFNFDIPYSDAGKTCSLVFLFPYQSQLVTSSFTFSGAGGLDFCKLNGVADHGTTYNNAPKCGTDYGVVTVSPGHSYTLATFPCPAGQRVSYGMVAKDGTCFKYFQDYNPAPYVPIFMFVLDILTNSKQHWSLHHEMLDGLVLIAGLSNCYDPARHRVLDLGGVECSGGR